MNAGERSVAAQPDRDAGRLVGWVGGVYPSAQFMARTQASDGQRIFTRAARSAKFRFAVRSLSGSNGQGKDKVRRLCCHLIHRGAVPLPLMCTPNLGLLEMGYIYHEIQL